MRVCFVAFAYAPAVGGAEKRVEKQARNLAARGHAVSVLTLRAEQRWRAVEDIHGVRVWRAGGLYRPNGTLRAGRSGVWIPMILALWLLWRHRHEFDVLHAAQMSPLAVPAAAIAALTGKPLVVTLQTNGVSPEERARIAAGPAGIGPAPDLRPEDRIAEAKAGLDIGPMVFGGNLLERLIHRTHPVFQALSQRSVRYLRAQGVPPDAIVHISGSVDTTVFHPAEEARNRKDQEQRPVVCVGRLAYSKGIDVLLRAWQIVVASMPAGTGPELWLVGEGGIRGPLEEFATTLGIASRVRFLGLRSDVVHLLREAQLVVLPSRWEGMPNALLEAMACGSPVVATRTSGSEDIVRDGIDGLLVEPENAEQLAGAIRRVLDDPALAQRLSGAARARVVDCFSLDRIMDLLVELYEDLAEHRSVGGRQETRRTEA